LAAARDAISQAFGVLPALWSGQAQGPLVREAQRHLCQWTLQPIAALIAEEASAKLGSKVSMDLLRPLQAYDSGGRARAMLSIVQALAAAKAGEVSQADLDAAMKVVDF
jgi:hypothetical protein